MRSVKFPFLLVATLLFASMSDAQTNTKPVDRLGVQGPISFDNTVFILTWSSHPTPTYYKQEYIKKGEDVNKFKSLFLVEVATGAIVLKNVVDAKIAELKSMQAGNPFISYELVTDTAKQEYLLDFVITQNSTDGKSAVIAERNVYRYKALPSKTGKQGIMLFAISTRSYGAGTKTFLAGLKTVRNVLVEKMRNYAVPPMTIK
jgi:hypothetical protein